MRHRINAIIFKIRYIIKKHGIIAVFLQLLHVFSKKKLRSQDVFLQLVRGKNGLEIGGPTKMFEAGGILPIYPNVKNIDICNISRVSDKVKYLCDSVDLSMVSTGTYDFVLASHTIEHITNPLKALSEWIRVLRSDGVVILVIPHRDGTFDHDRSITTLEHLKNDHEKGVNEDDLTHLSEILELTDTSIDIGCPSTEQFQKNVAANKNLRSIHMHVFDPKLAVEMFDHLKLQILSVEVVSPYFPFHIFIAAKKVPNGKPDNSGVLKQWQ